MWQRFLTYYKDNFPILSLVVEVLLLIPASNACIERGFSTMARIKDDERNRLGDGIVQDLLRIKIDGPDVDDFNADACVERFFSTPRNRG